MIQLILFSTSVCHLCEEAKAVLDSGKDEIEFAFSEIDIITDDELMEVYCARIPVLKKPSGEELDWPFDRNQLLEYLKR